MATPRKVELEKREIEHIDNTTEEEWCVSALRWEELSHIVVALVEDKSVETAVDEIAYRTHKYERYGDDEQHGCTFADIVDERPHHTRRGDNTEQGQKKFSDIAEEGHTESHTHILGKMQYAPVTYQRYLVTELHVCLNPDLKYLVGNQYQSYYKRSD